MGILRWPMDCLQEWPVTRKMFPFDAVIMWIIWPHDLYKYMYKYETIVNNIIGMTSDVLMSSLNVYSN